MPKFSKTSAERLQTCHPDIVTLFNTVIKYYDCTIVEGHRSKETQERYVREGKSKTMNSKHLKNPSMAVDAVTYKAGKGVDWNDKQALFFAGYVKGIADILYAQGTMKHKLRLGADWDMDYDVNDQTFNDYCHFELVEV